MQLLFVALWTFATGTEILSLSACSLPSTRHAEVVEDEAGSTWPWQTFKTSELQPPDMRISRGSGTLAPGYVLFAPYQSANSDGARQSANWVMTDDNDLVLGWDGTAGRDFRVQSYNGTPHITYWTGRDSQGRSAGHGYGHFVLLDDQYHERHFDPTREILTQFGPAKHDILDLHEHQVTDRGSLLTIVYENIPMNLSAVGGPEDGWIVNSRVVEFDIDTGAVLFEWNPVDHVSLRTSKQKIIGADPMFEGNGTQEAPWDWIHINSIDVRDDMLLIGARHTWTVYLVDRSGEVRWRLEGETGGDFSSMPEEATFRWQHYVRFHHFDEDYLTLSMFDNHNAGRGQNEIATRGLVLTLNVRTRERPLLVRRTEAVCQPLYANSQGSLQFGLENGNFFQAYGAIPVMREYDAAAFGKFSWEARFGFNSSVQSYRAFKQIWKATPRDWDPVLIVEEGFGYVSWNGATDIDSYHLLSGGDPTTLARRGCFHRRGFETKFPVEQPCVQVEAMREGVAVRKSNLVCRD